MFEREFLILLMCATVVQEQLENTLKKTQRKRASLLKFYLLDFNFVLVFLQIFDPFMHCCCATAIKNNTFIQPSVIEPNLLDIYDRVIYCSVTQK